MGLHMDDIHAPTVPSGPSGASNGVPKEQLSLTELITERDRVEKEILALADVLDSVCCTWSFRARQLLTWSSSME
jgi:26S proteasome regulatory subunit N4